MKTKKETALNIKKNENEKKTNERTNERTNNNNKKRKIEKENQNRNYFVAFTNETEHIKISSFFFHSL